MLSLCQVGLKLRADIGITQEDFFKLLKQDTLSLGVLSEASEENWNELFETVRL